MAIVSQKGSEMHSDKRQSWIGRVEKFLAFMEDHPTLPIPQMCSDGTWVAMMIGNYRPGELRHMMTEYARLVPGAIQEQYDWASLPDATQETKRVRLFWVGDGWRYEIDAAHTDVFGIGEAEPICEWVSNVGNNINTVFVPYSQRTDDESVC